MKALLNHYESKYSGDAPELIEYVKYPANRLESCVKYFANFSGSVLELGAGDGSVANSILKQNNQVSKYTISDINRTRLSGIKIKDKRVVTERIDVDDFDYVGKVDAVIMVALIEHLVDPLGAMKKIKQVLNPGGFVYIDTPNIADYGARFKLLTGRFPSTASRCEGCITYDGAPVTLHDEGHLHYFTYKSLSDMLALCGYRTVKHFQMTGRLFLGRCVHHFLARLWPEMFSSLILIAIKNEY